MEYKLNYYYWYYYFKHQKRLGGKSKYTEKKASQSLLLKSRIDKKFIVQVLSMTKKQFERCLDAPLLTAHVIGKVT